MFRLALVCCPVLSFRASLRRHFMLAACLLCVCVCVRATFMVLCLQPSCSLQSSEEMLAEARLAAEGMEGRLFESSRRAQEAEAAWEVEREILSQTNESSQVSSQS